VFKLPIKVDKIRSVLNTAPGLSSLAMPPQVQLGLAVADKLGVFGGKQDIPGVLGQIVKGSGLKVPSFLTPARLKVLQTIATKISKGGLTVKDATTLLNSLDWLKG
jgi:hypothetical protein